NVAALAELLGDADPEVARSAAQALGAIRSPSAAKALAAAQPRAEIQSAITDSSLACAEAMLHAGDKAGALKIYQRYAAGQQPRHLRLAATRGVLACAGTGK